MINLKENIIKRKNKKLKKELSGRQIQIKPVQKIAVLNNTSSNFRLDKWQLLQKLFGKNHSFDILTFKQKNEVFHEFPGIIASKDDFTSFGKIKNPEILDFLDREYDLLLDFTRQSNLYEVFLSLSVKANCRVGYYHPDELYDLMHDIPVGDVDNYLHESLKYLKILGVL